jgi:hypothetical protein
LQLHSIFERRVVLSILEISSGIDAGHQRELDMKNGGQSFCIVSLQLNVRRLPSLFSSTATNAKQMGKGRLGVKECAGVG